MLQYTLDQSSFQRIYAARPWKNILASKKKWHGSGKRGKEEEKKKHLKDIKNGFEDKTAKNKFCKQTHLNKIGNAFRILQKSTTFLDSTFLEKKEKKKTPGKIQLLDRLQDSTLKYFYGSKE